MQDIPLSTTPLESMRQSSVPLNIDNSQIIKNRTAYKISITLKSDDQSTHCIVIPPFGTYIGSRAELNRSTCVDWERMGLVICEDRRLYRRPGEVLRDTVNYVTGGSMLGLMGGLVPGLWAETWFWGVLVCVMLLVTLVSVPGLWSLLLQVVSTSFIYIVVALIGIGLPLLILDVWSDPAQLTLDNWLRCIAIGIFATLPASLFYLCYGLNLRRIRKQMIYDILQLDPQIQTIEAVEMRYGQLIDDTIGTKHGHVPFRGHVVVLMLTALLTMGWSMVFLQERFDFLGMFTHPDSPILLCGFLGAYTFALWVSFQRYMRMDIHTKCFVAMTVRLLQTMILAWLLYWIGMWMFGTLDGWPELLLAALAFIMGFMPPTTRTTIIVLTQRLRQLHPILLLPDRYRLLRDLDGLSLYDQSRLLGEGIENISHLVNFPLIDLLLRTRFPAHQLVDLIDQALLALYVGATTQRYQAQGQDPALQTLHNHGIRTATQLEHVAEQLQASKERYEKFLTLLDQGSGASSLRRIETILKALNSEEQMKYLRYWRKLHREHDKVYTLEQFCHTCQITLLPRKMVP